jgi:DNA-binding SARP family transcriptional activator/ABC-type branched-subunit amino acid transport system substrate-binding protein/DNA-binding beta-propeller fold protein YncE
VRDAIQARILGPLEIDVAGARVELRGGKQRELLAVLLIHADEVVSADRIIDALWGESPPSSALKTVQALVSRLRSTLGPASGALETHGHGYRLHLEPDQLDAAVFRMRLEEGRRALARGDAAASAELLRDALALWRGPALGEFRYEDFAQSEIARLDELRLAALEERIEADLALGRQQELVVELEELVSEQPLRERLRGQLMLALYRAGRQAEALSTYQEGRRALAEELGLEPGEGLQRLERQILDHDPEIAAPERATRPRLVPTAAWRRPRTIAAAGALVLAAAVGAGFYQSTRGGEQIESARAVALDPESGDVVASVPLGTAPGTVAIGEGSVWVLDSDDKTISQIDPDSRKVVRTFSTSSTPTDIAVGAGAVWVGNADDTGDGLFPQTVSRVDPESLTMETIELPPAPGGHVGAFAAGGRRLAVSPEAVWVINPDLTISRIDPRSNEIVARIRDVKAQDIAVGEGDVWVVEQENRVTEIDTGSNTVANRVVVEETLLGPLSVGGGAVWVTDIENGNVLRISGRKRTAIALDTWVADVSFGSGAVWVTNEIADTVYRIDPTTNVARRIDGLYSPRGVAAGDGDVWVTTAEPPSRDAALPSSVCSDVYFDREGEPDVLLVSDLTLKGDDARERTEPKVDAMRAILAQRKFEAGAFTVGYQSCDNATAQAGGLDFFRCAANAKTYARNLRVVAVFGSYQSPCSYAQIPITNEAEGGPLAMLSPSNTYGGLTNEDRLYPTGARSFFRIAARDDLEANAQVELAKQLGHDRVFFLTSEWREYGEFYEESVREAAKRLDVEIVGLAVFDHEAASFAGLAREIAKTQPEAVAIAAILTEGSGALVRELHAALGPDVPLFVPDGFRLIDDLVELTGPAAKRLYVSEYGIANDKLPPRGRQFLDAFAAARSGDAGPDLSASYGAQGAEILLDAIARSDGTRASVLEEIRRTRVENGILGDIAFGPTGDLVEAPYTYYRVRGGRFVPDRVVVVRTPRPGGR